MLPLERFCIRMGSGENHFIISFIRCAVWAGMGTKSRGCVHKPQLIVSTLLQSLLLSTVFMLPKRQKHKPVATSASLPVPEPLTTASSKDWKRISAESSLTSPPMTQLLAKGLNTYTPTTELGHRVAWVVCMPKPI